MSGSVIVCCVQWESLTKYMVCSMGGKLSVYCVVEESNFVYTLCCEVIYTLSVYCHCINLYTYCSY